MGPSRWEAESAMARARPAREVRLGAIQTAGCVLPPQANPLHRRFSIEALDAHVEAATARQIELFDRAGREGLDLIVGGEDLQQIAMLLPLDRPDLPLLRRYSHRVPGPLTDRLGAVARAYRMYLSACFFEWSRGRAYNCNVLFDRRGRIAGRYRKVHLPPQEACILSPGRDLPVFETDLGRVGVMICYDIMFPEAARCLALRGAQLLLHPTAGYGWTQTIGDVQVRSRAVDNSVAVVVACGRRSQVVDAWGDVVADAGRGRDVVVSAALDPRQPRRFAPRFFHRVMSGAATVPDEMLRERVPGAYGVLRSARPPALEGDGQPLYDEARKQRIRRCIARLWRARAAGRPDPIRWHARGEEDA
jgi:predicted amidohydrolase